MCLSTSRLSTSDVSVCLPILSVYFCLSNSDVSASDMSVPLMCLSCDIYLLMCLSASDVSVYL